MNINWKYGILDDAVNKGSSNISLNKIEKEEGDYPVYGAKGFAKNVSFFQQKEEYLAIIKDGAGIGRVSRHPSKSSVLATMQYIIPKEGFGIDFVKYFLESLDFENYRKGSTIPHIYYKDYKNATFPLVEVSEQKQIVGILDQAFSAIDYAKGNIEKNIQNARELFQSKLNDIFSQKGDGWEEKTLGELCSQIKDGAHHSPKILFSEKEPGLFPYITSKNIRNNYMDLTKLQYVNEEFHSTIYPVCSPKVGDILLTKDGANTGNITLNTLDEPFSLLSSVCLMKPDRDKLVPDFLKYYIQSPIGFKSITGKMTGTAIKRIILRTIKAATMPIPCIEKQEYLVSMMDHLYQETKQIELLYCQKFDSLEELKKSILQKAFARELTSESSFTHIKELVV